MNIEELELSLRNEFEGQMRNVVAGIRQDVAEFQKSLEAEFQKHRDQMDAALDALSGRFPESFEFDKSFKESLTEHLRLARDEGAQIAATAFGEAEKLRVESAPAGKYDLVRDAINAISARTTQSTILSALVDHAARFAPRGAFFIVKNDHLIGWRAFGDDLKIDERGVRDVHFELNSSSTLSRAIKEHATVRSNFGDHADDVKFLRPLGFGEPETMYAVPLSVRGRGVAVLYVDKGSGSEPNMDVLETMVRVAGLTVELLAASQSMRGQGDASQSHHTDVASAVEAVHGLPAPVGYQHEEETVTHETFAPAEEGSPVDEYTAQTTEVQPVEYVRHDEPAEPSYEEAVPEYSGEVEYEETPRVEVIHEVEAEPMAEEAAIEAEPMPEVEYVEEVEAEPVYEAEETASVEEVEHEPQPVNGFEFTSGSEFETSNGNRPMEMPDRQAEFAAGEVAVVSNGNGHSYAEPVKTAVDPVVEVAAVEPGRSRFGSRNVDLPIEVADEERRLHNDARRFARLLVSEIKLYNEQKVAEGRESGDLYDRLREAIDRSRDMYDKRVQPAVASKFDYFDYELVNSLAEGNVQKLGGSYPGAAV